MDIQKILNSVLQEATEEDERPVETSDDTIPDEIEKLASTLEELAEGSLKDLSLEFIEESEDSEEEKVAQATSSDAPFALEEKAVAMSTLKKSLISKLLENEDLVNILAEKLNLGVST